MEWIVLLGFELEIYQPYEYAGMYWVVQHYISSRILHIDRIRNHLLYQSTLPTPEGWIAQQQESLAYLTFLSLEAKAQHDLVVTLLNVLCHSSNILAVQSSQAETNTLQMTDPSVTTQLGADKSLCPTI